MDNDAYFSILGESSSFNLENLFHDNKWASLSGISHINLWTDTFSQTYQNISKDNLNEINEDQFKLDSFQFSQKVHSLIDEYYQRKNAFFIQMSTSHNTHKFKNQGLNFLKNYVLEYIALNPLIENSFPGMHPKSSWPVCLDDILEKISNLKIDEIFHQPFDFENNFLKECEEYINESFEKEHLIEYLPKAIGAFLSIFILFGNIKKLEEIFSFLSSLKEKYNNKFDEIFKKTSKYIIPILEQIRDYSQKLQNHHPILSNYQINEAFLINNDNIFAPSKYTLAQNSSITTDGTYLYIVLSGINGSMSKIGTGYNNTIQGKVYFSKSLYDENEYQWVFLKGKLYAKIGLSEEISIFDSNNFENLGKIKLLLPENIHHPQIKKRSERFILTTDNERLQIITLEPEINPNPKNPYVVQQNNQRLYSDEEDEEQFLNGKDNSKDTIYDIFTCVNLVLLSYDIESDNKDNIEKIKSTLSEEKQNLINELHESFSYYFSYDNCHRALEMFSWDFEKATMYLIDNGEQVKEDILISDDKKILYSVPLEGIRNLSGYYEFKEIEENKDDNNNETNKENKDNNNNNNNNKTIKTKFDINSYNSLKWTRPNGYLIGYKFNEAVCYVFKDYKFLGKYRAIEFTHNDYLLTYDNIHNRYYCALNYTLISQSVIFCDCFSESLSLLEKKIDDDININFNVNENNFSYENFIKEMKEHFFKFSINKNRAYWKFKNWDYFYNSCYDNTINMGHGIGQTELRKFTSKLKNLVHKMEKIKKYNEIELYNQLKKIYKDIDKYDLDYKENYL